MTSKEILEKVLENCKDKQKVRDVLVEQYPEIYKFGCDCASGKKALEELRFQVGNITYFTHDLQMTTFKVRDSGLFEIILKDLEVLEIIKKYAYEINFSIENEDTKKVEDWLYDDK